MSWRAIASYLSWSSYLPSYSMMSEAWPKSMLLTLGGGGGGGGGGISPLSPPGSNPGMAERSRG